MISQNLLSDTGLRDWDQLRSGSNVHLFDSLQLPEEAIWHLETLLGHGVVENLG